VTAIFTLSADAQFGKSRAMIKIYRKYFSREMSRLEINKAQMTQNLFYEQSRTPGLME